MKYNLAQMAAENNWAGVKVDEDGIMLYHATDAGAAYGWRVVPPEKRLPKYCSVAECEVAECRRCLRCAKRQAAAA